jgi:hypothetical protein
VTITLEITSKLQEELARQAAAHGSGVEAYAATLLEEAIHLPEDGVFDRARARAAAARIRELRKGVTLGGLTIKDLINEGRR